MTCPWAPCVALALLAASCGDTTLGAAEAAGAGSAPRPDVLVVAIDGIGPEHVDALTGDRALAETTGLDRLASEAAVYLDAYATSPWPAETLRSALFGEVTPGEHGVPGLARELDHLGYRTVLVLAHDSHVTPDDRGDSEELFGFSEVIHVFGHDDDAGARAEDVATEALATLEAEPGPMLLVVTFADPRPPHHLYGDVLDAADQPYDGPVLSGLTHAELLRRAPEFTNDDRARLAELHATEVTMVDRAFARVAGATIDRRVTPPVICALGLRRPALGATAESGARRYGLVPSLEPAALRVPLMIRFPVRADGSRQAGDIPVAVSIADVAPTILDSLGVATRLDIDGRSVVPGASVPERPVLALSTRGLRGGVHIDGGAALSIVVDGDGCARRVMTDAGWSAADDWKKASSAEWLVGELNARGVSEPEENRSLIEQLRGDP